MTRWHAGRRQFLKSTAAAGAGFAMPGIIRANAADATINKWIDEFQPSPLSRDGQIEELTWFQTAAKPYKGMDIWRSSRGEIAVLRMRHGAAPAGHLLASASGVRAGGGSSHRRSLR